MPVHQDQLWAQHSDTSMRKLYLTFTFYEHNIMFSKSLTVSTYHHISIINTII